MIRVSGQYRRGAVQLLRKDDARELVRQSYRPERDLSTRSAQSIGTQTIGPTDQEGGGLGTIVANLAEEPGKSLARKHLAVLVEGDDEIGIARKLEKGGAFLGASLGGARRAALGRLVPHDGLEPQWPSSSLEAIAIPGEELALGAILEPADRGDDEAHSTSASPSVLAGRYVVNQR
jgi:hypothetical protein